MYDLKRLDYLKKSIINIEQTETNITNLPGV